MGNPRDDLLDALGDEDDLRPVTHQIGDRSCKELPAADVQTGEGIVEDQELRRAEQGAGDEDLPEFAVGERPEPVFEKRAKSQEFHKTVKDGRVSVIPEQHLPRRECVSLVAAEETGLLLAVLAKEDLLLKLEGDIADPRPRGLRVMADQFSPDMGDIPFDCPGQGRFPRSVGPQDRPVFPCPYLP